MLVLIGLLVALLLLGMPLFLVILMGLTSVGLPEPAEIFLGLFAGMLLLVTTKTAIEKLRDCPGGIAGRLGRLTRHFLLALKGR